MYTLAPFIFIPLGIFMFLFPQSWWQFTEKLTKRNSIASNFALLYTKAVGAIFVVAGISFLTR